MKQTRLYNVIFPLWLLLFFPQIWLIALPGNLLIDCAVLLLGMTAMKLTCKKQVLKRVWWKIWLLGFVSDFVGCAWMMLVLLPAYLWAGNPLEELWSNTVGHIMHNSFAHPAAFLWTLIGVALAGVCIYLFDRRVLRRCPELSEEQAKKLALIMAVVTAPWLFFIPMY